jgi:glutamyl/glutaminyl-tRNA synthetase
MNYVGRIAPSPTGLLHLGHARTFWIAQQRAHAAHGQLLLRDEDLDRQRSRLEFSSAMKEDLRWLGITWDAELRQSDRLRLYRAAMEQLLAAGLAYPCSCSRRDLALSTQAPHEDDDEPIYDGRCRPSDSERSPELSAHTNYRFRIGGADPVRFTDRNAGPQRFTPDKDFGDFVLWRKALRPESGDRGLPSYQLACVVDDALTGVTEVVRGRDLLKSTARQMLLQRALGYATPAYFHTDLVLDAGGVRLAKRHDALSLRALRESGLAPQQVLALF